MARERTITLTLLDEEAEAVIANLEKFGHVNRPSNASAEPIADSRPQIDEEERMRLIEQSFGTMTDERAEEILREIKAMR